MRGNRRERGKKQRGRKKQTKGEREGKMYVCNNDLVQWCVNRRGVKRDKWKCSGVSDVCKEEEFYIQF